MPQVCAICGITGRHTFECRARPKGGMPVVQVDRLIIELLIAMYSKNKSETVSEPRK
jgi:hypothetical protein